MSNATVDSAMKSRIMNAVSAAIKEQSEYNDVSQQQAVRTARKAEITGLASDKQHEEKTRKKARKTPVALISSIAAGIVVILGVFFVFTRMNSGKKDSATAHNTAVAGIENELSAAADNNDAVFAEENEDFYDSAAETGANAETGGNSYSIDDNDKNIYAVAPDNENKLTIDPDAISEIEQRSGAISGESEGMGDIRLDRIAKALPFDIMGTGSGSFSDTITEEVFLGVDGEKAILFTAPEGTDIVKTVYRANQDAGIDGTTPEGMEVKLYRIPFGNVTAASAGDSEGEVNCAVFDKNGHTYMLVFSDVRIGDVICKAADAI